MRPLRLELEGFMPFRERQEVNFEGADLFLIAGPTGSGKSSLVDAMVFALYGRIPRLGEQEVTTPVITQGAQEARVRFEFEVEGERYTAVRVLRRRGEKAETREARLEKGEEVLAGSAKELTRQVEQLLGLSFAHFTKAVLLPQGEFARFLHDPPKERSQLLARLLGLDVYQRMSSRARELARSLEGEARILGEKLEELSRATPEAIQEQKDRVRKIETHLARAEQSLAEMERAEQAARLAREEADRARARHQALLETRVPERDIELAREIRREREAASRAEEERLAALEERRQKEEERKELPEKSRVETDLRRLGELEERERELARAEEARLRAEALAEEARRALEQAEEAEEAARRDLEGLRHRHAAYDLARGLKAGDPCPVCGQPVPEVLERTPPPDLGKAEQVLKRAGEERKEREKALRGAEQKAAGARTRKEQLEQELQRLRAELEGIRREDLLRLLDLIEGAEKALEAARRRHEEAEEKVRSLKGGLVKLEEKERVAWQALDSRRDTLAQLGLEPPVLARQELEEDWRALEEWARRKAPEVEEAARDAEARAEKEEAAILASLEEISRISSEVGLELPPEARDRPEPLRAALKTLGQRLEEAKFELHKLEEKREEAERTRARLAEVENEAQVARDLAEHLRSDGFPRWVEEEARRELLEGATAIMRKLYRNRYSLVDAGGDILVQDHENADETRPAKTLSGGETFLASLSLALALGEYLASEAAGRRSETLLLDEGFGTLDPETLDVVTDVIGDLAEQGRTVGIISHVKELEEVVPYIFEVRKEGRTSRVKRRDLS